MARRCVVGGIFMASLLAAGCLTPRSAPFEVPGNSLAEDLLPGDGRVARSQFPEPPPLPAPALPPLKPPLVLPPPETVPASLTTPPPFRVRIRAHVNGKPIFDDEVMQVLGPNLRYLQSLPEPKRSEKMADLYNQALEKLVEDEIMYQDAVRKLEKFNPRALDKLKSLAGDEFDKILKRIRESGMPESQVREILPTLRKQNERNFIAVEYVRSRVVPIGQSRIGHMEIQEYYDTHKNEFQRLDTVKWQDVFILAGGTHPTVTDARRFAEDLVAGCRTSADFVKLVRYDDGDAKLRGGEGIGQRREDIRPVELAQTLLRMKEGQIDIVDIGTGVHIVRVLAREYAGPIPLNEATQKQIRRKLESQIIQREYQRIVRELKQRAVIEIDQGS